MTTWERIANEALESLGDRARDIISERRAEGKDDSADDITEELSFGGEVEDEVESAEIRLPYDFGEAFTEITENSDADYYFREFAKEEEDLKTAVYRTLIQMAIDEVEEALDDLADELREDFPDLEDDYGDEAGA